MNIDINSNIEELEISELLDASEKIDIPKKTLRERIGTLSRHILLICISIITFFPFIWMVTSALKSREEIFTFPPKIIAENPNWGIFAEVFKEAPFGTYMFNSLSVASVEVIIQTISAAMIAYALTQFKFKGRGILFVIVMCTYMLPSAVTYVPCYIILADLNLLDTLTGLIVSNLVNVFGIFLMRQAFMQVDKSFIEAARIDGASEFKIFHKIGIPMMGPGIATIAITTFIGAWNNYLMPLVLLFTPEKFTLPVMMASLKASTDMTANMGATYLAIAVSVVPIMIAFAFLSKYIISSIAAGGVKE